MKFDWERFGLLNLVTTLPGLGFMAINGQLANVGAWVFLLACVGALAWAATR